MPSTEIPEDELQDSKSSASSNSSIRIYPRPLIHQRDSLSTNSSLESELGLALENSPRFQNPFPVEPLYLPIIFPREPTLDELLRQVTGREDLQTVETIKLRVISYMVSLQRIPVFMPRLSSLNLDGSVVSSLRDLGCNFEHLKYLNVSNCGLKSLDGTNGIPTVEILIADGNGIEDVGPCCNLIELKRLSVKNNRIQSMGLLSFLALCPLLNELNLEGNPVTHRTTYRDDVIRNIESLELLDGITVDSEAERSIGNTRAASFSSSENPSSLSDSTWPDPENDNNNSLSPQKSQQRPASSHETMCHISIVERPHHHFKRPMSAGIDAGWRSGLTASKMMQGSIINRARSRKQVKSAWGYSSTSSSASVSSTDCDQEKQFPEQLPQIPVELEFGIVGMNPTNSCDRGRSETSGSTESLKNIAKKWRQECQRKRNENL